MELGRETERETERERYRDGISVMHPVVPSVMVMEVRGDFRALDFSDQSIAAEGVFDTPIVQHSSALALALVYYMRRRPPVFF